MKGEKQVQTTHPNRVNDEVCAQEVHLISLEGEQLGIVSPREALEKAEETGIDLVKVSPNAKPPVYRIIDYGKFLYERSESSKGQRKKQEVVQVKEIKFCSGTDKGDYQVKFRSLIRFLEENDKAEITLRFRDREMAHQQIGMEVFNRMRDDLQELAVVELFPTEIEGHQMIMVLTPKKKQ